MKKHWLCAVPLLLVTMAAFAGNPQLRADREAVAQACAGDAAAAHCPPPGRGMQACIKAFRRANPGFRGSPACRGAKQQLHSDRLALRPRTY